MAHEAFSFKPATIPELTRGQKRSKYATTVEAVHKYLNDHADQQAVKIELGGVSVKAAVASFRNVIAKQYKESLRLVQRNGELYIERR